MSRHIFTRSYNAENRLVPVTPDQSPLVSLVYDAGLRRFVQADSRVPEGVQGYDRYACVNNAPTRYADRSGPIASNRYVRIGERAGLQLAA